jgi:hypothetical protein
MGGALQEPMIKFAMNGRELLTEPSASESKISKSLKLSINYKAILDLNTKQMTYEQQ